MQETRNQLIEKKKTICSGPLLTARPIISQLAMYHVQMCIKYSSQPDAFWTPCTAPIKLLANFVFLQVKSRPQFDMGPISKVKRSKIFSEFFILEVEALIVKFANWQICQHFALLFCKFLNS